MPVLGSVALVSKLAQICPANYESLIPATLEWWFTVRELFVCTCDGHAPMQQCLVIKGKRVRRGDVVHVNASSVGAI